MKRAMVALWLVGAVVGCSVPEQVLGPSEPPPVIASATATRGALATSTLASLVPPQPSATPDPALLPEQFVSERGELSFRYPAGWKVSDVSDESESVVTVQSPPTAEVDGVFVANLQNVGGPLNLADLQLLADTYLTSLFGEALPSLPRVDREEGESYISTVVAEEEGQLLQYEIRFAARPPFSQVLVLIAPQPNWEQVAPLLDAMARSVVVNPAQAPTLATPTVAAARQSEGLSAQNVSLYRGPTGSLYVVGEILNESGIFFEDVQVSLSLVGADGAELAHTQWPAKRKLLPPGERSPFQLILDQPPASWADGRVRVEALPASTFLNRITSEFEVTAVQASDAPAFGEYGLSGTLRNTGADARFVEVTGVLYDAAGKILAVESGTVVQDTLASGAQAPFTLTFFGKAEGEVARHEIIVEGTRLTSQE